MAPTAAMAEIITEIMVEALTIFGIATEELRWGSASEFQIGYLRIRTELCVEEFLKRLARSTDLEDALKTLDRLIDRRGGPDGASRKFEDDHTKYSR